MNFGSSPDWQPLANRGSTRPLQQTAPLPSETAPGNSTQKLRDRRREKPLLSCSFCRSRKVRCDRQLPCQTCTGKGIGITCTYMSGPLRRKKVSVGDRIQQLESLVQTLVQQQGKTPQNDNTHMNSGIGGSGSFGNSPAVTTGTPESLGEDGPAAPHDDGTTMLSVGHTSPDPSESGSMRLHSHGANYVGSVHWAAVLDSISDLKDHYKEEEEAKMLASTNQVRHQSPGPRLLYEPVHDTKDDILASIPAQPVVDRMVARYFNAQNSSSLSILHSGHFLREYEKFWKDPSSAPFLWIGLLFSMMALAGQLPQVMDDPADPQTLACTHLFRERTVHCLVLGEYTKGGEYVLETILNCITLDIMLSKDADIGLWLMLGMLVQIALSRGYHRDPRNFPALSPFVGEMRRRVWAVVMQMDLRLSSQMGLPRLLKVHQCDTLEPRNLLDIDFDEDTAELPQSRPETEFTPVLYVLAKSRIDRMSNLVSDLLAETSYREHPYAEIMDLDRRLHEAERSLPTIFQWRPLSQSFMVPPHIVVHRILLHLSMQRLTVWLHRKYLAPSYTASQYEYSRNACVQSAIQILEIQQLIDEETQPDGLLYPVRFMTTTSLGQFVFLLGMSILSYYVQLAKTRPDISSDSDTSAKILRLLHNSYSIWLRTSAVSQEARKAVDHLSRLLGLRAPQDSNVGTNGAATTEAEAASPSQTETPHDVPMSVDQVTWGPYQDYFAGFPATSLLGTDFLNLSMPRPSSASGVRMADMVCTAPTDVDGLWNLSENSSMSGRIGQEG